MQAKESQNSRAQDEAAEENKADQKALTAQHIFFGFNSKSQRMCMFACMPCRSNCSRGFFNDQPEILMQQSTNIINLIESPDFLCLESFDFSEVNAAHAVACFFFKLLSRSPEI